MRAKDELHVSTKHDAAGADAGPVLLPPRSAPDKSVLRSIAALEEAEQSGHADTTGRAGRRAAPPPVDVRVIDIEADGPFTPAGARDAHAAGPARPHSETPRGEPQRKSAEPVQPLRANAFRPNGAQEEEVRPKSRAWLRTAAAIAIFVGAGWLAAPLLQGQLPFAGGSASARLSPLEQMQLDLRKVTTEAAALRAALAQIDSPQIRASNLADADALKKSLADLARRLDQARAAQSAALAELGARFDRARAEETRQRDEMLDRLARLEKMNSDGRPTATIAPHGSSVVPRAAVVQQPAPDQDIARKPTPLAGFVLHEVQNGVALVEGRRGFIEAYPGATIPGAGRVQSIVRRGGAWVVVTSNGVIGPKFD